MTAIHWFRRDLRLGDNPALHAAAGTGDVLALYVIDPRLWASAGAPRRAYLARSLAALDAQTGGRLLVRHGDPRQVVPAVAREVAATAVHVAASYEPFGRRRDDAVEWDLEEAGVPLVRTGSPYAVAPGRVRNGSGGDYKVFTPFRRAWSEHGWRAPAPDAATTAATVTFVDGGRGDRVPDAPVPDGMTLPEAGEPAALARWAEMLDGPLTRYATERDRPDLDSTSRLSVPLKWGEIHPRTLLADLAGRGGDGAETFRSQIAWREFHADVLFHHPAARRESLTPVVPESVWVNGSTEQDLLDAWAAGRTGYPMVDAGMRQLLAEGWMHNRLRMLVASFLVKDLHVRWQRGADHFLAWLVDGDVPQNQLNWQWVAGTGRDASPYFRVFNPVTQGVKFDPAGRYVRRWVPELRDVPGRAVHEPWKLPRSAAPDYPDRIVDHATERAVSLGAYHSLR
ncbi:cryptochrome/photolyase family protein [Cellulomonas hominis]|uniref:cryptochrome/photolyase family protein n=1 Tax=Cellulomonas hominis TaxID=156981 RepID=UPI001B99B75E|nr:deoxyribodipyrimidine photo-lyase [Cellulomonas hominis]VTR76564.1 Deoxyribodipyrimidine photo-lyase [Cellulomonas hominis]